jgi:hypothetical protein
MRTLAEGRTKVEMGTFVVLFSKNCRMPLSKEALKKE